MGFLPFAKVEGLGNDFIVVDLRPGRAAADVRPLPTDPEVARALCDRHFGIGADGVLAILPGDDGDVRMRVINADGSDAEMCGNGIRCVARVLFERDPNLHRSVINIDTGAGLLACTVEAGTTTSIAVQMGRPRLNRDEIPMAGTPAGRVLKLPVSCGGRTFAVTAVSMGNPHAVIFVDDPSVDLRALAETFGPALERHELFPRKTNVEFARVRAAGPDDAIQIDLVVWERGCGITLACGTGACATAVAACLEGRALPDRELTVHLPGGPLQITAHQDTTSPAPKGSPGVTTFAGVTMRGPAEIVFEAEIDPGAVMDRGKVRGS